MPQFKYAVKTADGKERSGTISAPTRDDAMGELRRQNLTVLSMTELKSRAARSLFGGEPRARVRGDDMAVFTRQLATMISAGIPLVESMEILEEQAEDPGFKLVCGRIIESVRSGTDFSEALSKYPKIFNRIYVSMVKAGEASGALDTILVRLAQYMEASEALRREIKSAMTYPVVSLVLILLIVGGLLVGIVPKFETIFVTLGVDLPAPTQILLSVSRFLSSNILYILAGIAAAVTGFILWKKTSTGERQWHWILLKVPIFGPLLRKVAISRFARTFATLIQSGVPILGALEIVSVTTGNRIIEEAVTAAKESVKKGETLGEPLGRSGVFPPMVTRMISIGERSGALEQLLEKISEFYDQQVKTTVEALTSLIEPLLIAVMGALVGGIVLSIFLPILKIQEALRRK